MRTAIPGAVLLAMLAGPGMGGPVSLLAESTFRTDRVAFIPMGRIETDDDRPGGPSLFAMLDGRALWAPEGRAGIGLGASASDFAGALATRAARLRDVIARAEAGAAGYDAVQHGARVRPPDRPTAMTIAEIYDWIDATPGQPHAIGRYQFIPKTLRALVDALEIDPEARFSRDVQNRLADRLLAEAGLHAFDAGTLSRDRFMLNLARIWAGLPTSSGRSFYDGYAGNKATMSWAAFDTAMAEIFPPRSR